MHDSPMNHLRPIDQYEAPKYQVHIAPKAHAQLGTLPIEISDRIEQGLGDLAEVAESQMVRMILRRSPELSGGHVVDVAVAEHLVACLDIDDAEKTITLVEVTSSQNRSSALPFPIEVAQPERLLRRC
jgi:mRNA-degrading endonuclease RelE of RelBE toxin-antitoxin system